MKKTSKKKKLRPLGDITADMEPLLEELTDRHDLQWGEIIFLVHSWLAIHAPSQQEEYIEGGSPILYGFKSKSNVNHTNYYDIEANRKEFKKKLDKWYKSND